VAHAPFVELRTFGGMRGKHGWAYYSFDKLRTGIRRYAITIAK
jgi:hypothetical protein